jgi:HK97 family phage portal protein
MMEGHLALRGNAFNEVFANRRGEIEALIPIHPDRIKIEMLDNGSYRYRIRRVDGTEDIRPRGDIWHLRGLSSDGIVGLSPLELAREVIGLGLSAQSFGSRFFYNDAKPGGWLEMPVGGKFKDDDEKDKFKQNWQKGYSGANRGKTAILEGGMKYHELTLNNADAQFLETHKQNRVEIAGLFGVPAHRVNELDRATFSNIEQQSLDFVVGTMTPIAERWESSITTFLLPEDEDLEVEFDFANLVRGDMAARGVFYNKLFNMGSLSPNDIRAREGEPEVEGGDIYLVPMNMVTLENAGKPQAKKGVRPAPANQSEPEETSTEEEGSTDARMAQLLEANATRMARRIAGGKTPAVEVLAEALAISQTRAQAWLDSTPVGQDPDALTAQLLALAAPALKKEPQ